MSERDLVEDLDHWIRGSVQADPVLILKRARDEIVALREYKSQRAETLEDKRADGTASLMPAPGIDDHALIKLIDLAEDLAGGGTAIAAHLLLLAAAAMASTRSTFLEKATQIIDKCVEDGRVSRR
jgi:hypothetical protein